MKTTALVLCFFALPIWFLGLAQAQDIPATGDSMASMEMKESGKAQPNPPQNPLPKIGQFSQVPTGPIYRLDELEGRALQHNPTLTQADTEVRSAEGRKIQAGLWSNPTVGYLGDEIAGGIGVNGGRQGGFVEQTITLGRKLFLAQQVAGHDVQIARLEKEEQRYRVQNAVRLAYFRTLAAQELVALAEAYVKVSADTLDTSRRLQNMGARDESEVAMAEIESERAKLAADLERAQLDQEWDNLRSVVGEPSLPRGFLDGKLDVDTPNIDDPQLVDALLRESPAARIAQENVTRSESFAMQARRQAVPDLRVRAGVEQNFEQNDLTGKPFGLEGFAELRMEIPIFNRNQGNTAAAQAELEGSRAELRRMQLELRQQASRVVEQYEVARLTVEHYQKQILPKTHGLYEMQVKAWGRMALAYPQVLSAEQNLFSTQAEYIRALRNLRTNGVALSGFLLTDGLAEPGMKGTERQPGVAAVGDSR